MFRRSVLRFDLELASCFSKFVGVSFRSMSEKGECPECEPAWGTQKPRTLTCRQVRSCLVCRCVLSFQEAAQEEEEPKDQARQFFAERTDDPLSRFLVLGRTWNLRPGPGIQKLPAALRAAKVFHHDPSGDGFFLFSDSTRRPRIRVHACQFLRCVHMHAPSPLDRVFTIHIVCLSLSLALIVVFRFMH